MAGPLYWLWPLLSLGEPGQSNFWDACNLSFKYERMGEMVGLCIVVGRAGPFGRREINLDLGISAPLLWREYGFGGLGSISLAVGSVWPFKGQQKRHLNCRYFEVQFQKLWFEFFWSLYCRRPLGALWAPKRLELLFVYWHPSKMTGLESGLGLLHCRWPFWPLGDHKKPYKVLQCLQCWVQKWKVWGSFWAFVLPVALLALWVPKNSNFWCW